MIHYAEPLEILRFATRDDLQAEIARQQEEIAALRQDLADLRLAVVDLLCANTILRAQKRQAQRRLRFIAAGQD